MAHLAGIPNPRFWATWSEGEAGAASLGAEAVEDTIEEMDGGAGAIMRSCVGSGVRGSGCAGGGSAMGRGDQVRTRKECVDQRLQSIGRVRFFFSFSFFLKKRGQDWNILIY